MRKQGLIILYLQAFDERELELVIGGLGTIDLQDWKTNTRLKHCTVETPQVSSNLEFCKF